MDWFLDVGASALVRIGELVAAFYREADAARDWICRSR